MKCRKCKEQMTKTTDDHSYRESGLENILLQEIDIFRCDCGERVVSIPAMPELNAMIGRILVQKKSPLTGREIRFLRKNMGLTGKRLSEIMGVDNATISRWESDLQRPAKTHDHFFRLLYVTEKGVPTDQARQLIEAVFPKIDPSISPMPNMVLNPGAWLPK
ncbi:MAG: type II TA system antitoxin MqsA family protein [Desulfatirhabdiaceae bacterium]